MQPLVSPNEPRLTFLLEFWVEPLAPCAHVARHSLASFSCFLILSVCQLKHLDEQLVEVRSSSALQLLAWLALHLDGLGCEQLVMHLAIVVLDLQRVRRKPRSS
jgi:hypothetical protein